MIHQLGRFLLRVWNISSVWIFWESDANMEFHVQDSKSTCKEEIPLKEKEKVEQVEAESADQRRKTRKDDWERRNLRQHCRSEKFSARLKLPQNKHCHLEKSRVEQALVNLPCSAIGLVHPGKSMSSASTTWQLWSWTPGGNPLTTLLRGVSLELISERSTFLPAKFYFKFWRIQTTH